MHWDLKLDSLLHRQPVQLTNKRSCRTMLIDLINQASRAILQFFANDPHQWKIGKFEFKVTVHNSLWAKCTQLWPLKCICLLMFTSKNPCYAQAIWDWICLKKQNKTKQKTKQNKTKTNKQRIKRPTRTFPTTSKRFRIKITNKQTT